MTSAKIFVVVALVGASAACSKSGLNTSNRGDGATDTSTDVQSVLCFDGGRSYAIGERFEKDCNTCTCTASGIACTLIACFTDAGRDLGAESDANTTCKLSGTLTFGYDGGNALHVDVNRIEGDSFAVTRTYNAWTGVEQPAPRTCSPSMPACDTAGVVTVATIQADLMDTDVQSLWTLPQNPVPLFGTDPRPVDGAVYSIALAGHQVLVGGQCASPVMSSCRYIPPGLLRLTQDLQKLATAMVADPACKGL